MQNVLEYVPGVSQWYYKHTFEDSGILEDYSVSSIVTRTYCDVIKVMTLDISYATRYIDSFSPSPAYKPTEEKDAKFIDHSTETLQPNECKYKQYCSEVACHDYCGDELCNLYNSQ